MNNYCALKNDIESTNDYDNGRVENVRYCNCNDKKEKGKNSIKMNNMNDQNNNTNQIKFKKVDFDIKEVEDCVCHRKIRRLNSFKNNKFANKTNFVDSVNKKRTEYLLQIDKCKFMSKNSDPDFQALLESGLSIERHPLKDLKISKQLFKLKKIRNCYRNKLFAASSTNSINSSPNDSFSNLSNASPNQSVSASLNASMNSSTFSESQFDEYLTKYTVSTSDFLTYYVKQLPKSDDFNLNMNTKECINFLPVEQEKSKIIGEFMDEERIEHVTRTLHEIFLEGCCSLYGDLRDALDYCSFDYRSETILKFFNRFEKLVAQGNELAANVPIMAETVQLRISTLERAMEQLRVRREHEYEGIISEVDNSYNGTMGWAAPAQRFRKWLQSSEYELHALKKRVGFKSKAPSDLSSMRRLRADHQVLQLQIETEGRALLNSAYQQLHTERQVTQEAQNCITKRTERWHRNLEALEHRWYTHWLANLEALEIIQRRIDELSESNHDWCSESDSDNEEPLCKRPRSLLLTSTKVQDCTIENPFSAVENEFKLNFYPISKELLSLNEKINMTKNQNESSSESNGVIEMALLIIGNIEDECSISSSTYGTNGTCMRIGTGEGRASANSETDIDSGSNSTVAAASHDVGYSSGECNSLFESIFTSNEEMFGAKLDNELLVKSYYRTVPLDDAGVTDTEFSGLIIPPLSPSADNPNNLSDSLIVQTDNTFNQPTHHLNSGFNDEMSKPLNDFEQVMEIMDEQFHSQLEILRRGTQWRELRANPPRRTSGSKSSKTNKFLHSFGARFNVSFPDQKTMVGSCDASSEESDTNRLTGIAKFRNSRSLPSSLCCTSGISPKTQKSNIELKQTSETDDKQFRRRKRFHKRSIQHPSNKANFGGNGTTVLIQVPVNAVTSTQNESKKNDCSKLKNISMIQSVYVTANSDSKNIQNDELDNGEKNFIANKWLLIPSVEERRIEMDTCDGAGRKKHQLGMHRSASDNEVSCGKLIQENKNHFIDKMSVSNYENYHHHYHHHYYICNNCKQHQQHQRQNLCNFKYHGKLVRTCSTESFQSSISSSSSTVHESGDANFEWDEYKDLNDLLMPSSCAEFDNSIRPNNNAPKHPIFSLSSSIYVGVNDMLNKTLFARQHDQEELKIQSSNDELTANYKIVNAILKKSQSQLCHVEKIFMRLSSFNQKFQFTQKKLSSVQSSIRKNLNQLNELKPHDLTQSLFHESLLDEWKTMEKRIDRKLNVNKQDEIEFWTEKKLYSDFDINTDNTPHNNEIDKSLPDEKTVSLQVVLDELKTQLRRLMFCDNKPAPLSLKDLESVVIMRKEILRCLMQYRNDLRVLTAEAQKRSCLFQLNQPEAIVSSSSKDSNSDVRELMTLVDMVEKSLTSIDTSTHILERMREDFAGICTLFVSLNAKIDRLSSMLNHATEMSMTSFVESIEFELELCQERMNALETVCNTIANHLTLTYTLEAEYREMEENTIYHISKEHMTTDVSTPAEDNEDEIPAEPHPPCRATQDASYYNSSYRAQEESLNCEILQEFLQFRTELSRLKERFKKTIALQEVTSGLVSDTSVSYMGRQSPRKRRLDLSDENNINSSTQESELIEQARADTPVQMAHNNMLSVGTQSNVTNIMINDYETRFTTTRATQHASKHLNPSTFAFVKGACAALRGSSLAQLCFGCTMLLFIGLVFLRIFFNIYGDRDPMLSNNYLRTFGPQLDYICGPPPH